MNSLKLSFIILLLLTITIVTVFNAIVIRDPDTDYNQIWFIFDVIILAIIFIYLMLLVYVYYNPKFNYANILTKKPVYLAILIMAGAYLLAFGFSSILVNELTISTNEPDYDVKKINNDDVAIYSLLVGLVIVFLSIVNIFNNV